MTVRVDALHPFEIDDQPLFDVSFDVRRSHNNIYIDFKNSTLSLQPLKAKI